MFRYRAIAVFVLILLLTIPSVARGAEGDATLFGANPENPGFVDFAVAIDGTLYIRWGNLLTYKLGDAEPKVIAELPAIALEAQKAKGNFDAAADEAFEWRDRLTCPFEYDGKLHMIHELTGDIMVFEDEKFVSSGMRIDLPDIPDQDHSLQRRFGAVFGFEDMLYVLVRNDVMSWEAPMELWAVDPANGRHRTIPTEFPVSGVCAYEPGMLLGWTPPVSGAGGEESFPRLFAFEADTGETIAEPVVAVKSACRNLASPAYDAETGAIYYVLQNRLLRKTSLRAEPEVLSYFDKDLYQGASPTSILGGSHLVFLSSYGEVYIRNIQGEPVKDALRLSWYDLPDSAKGFMGENPDIAIEIVDNGGFPLPADEIAQRINGGDHSVDIFIVGYDAGVRQLIQKGYAMDMSGNEAVARAVNRMYAPIREAVTAEGKVMGFPLYVSHSMWAYNEKLFTELGLAYPETFSDFIDLFERWEEEMKDENPSIWFSPDYEYLKANFGQFVLDNYMLIEQYILEFGSPDAPLKFDTPEFRGIMQKLKSFPANNDVGGQDVFPYDEHPEVLFERLFDVTIKGMRPALAPRAGKDSEAVIGANLKLYIINPNSRNAEKAMKFMEYVADHGEYDDMLPMYPDYNEPLPWPGVVLQLEDERANLKEIRGMAVTDENRRDIEQMIKEAEQEIEKLESQYWRVSPETIEAYRALLDGNPMVVDMGRGQLIDIAEIRGMIERYLSGQMDIDQTVRELDQRMEMIFLERQ